MRKSLFIHIGIIFAFLVNTLGAIPVALAQTSPGVSRDFRLPAPGVRVHLSPPFAPPILKGIKIHPENPLRFDFILDKGDDSPSLVQRGGEGELEKEATRLIKYFLASLTIPEKDLWVNLSPYEKDRIIPNSFGLTEMGRDLLAEDYILKQITASLIYPEDTIGKKFWKRIYEEVTKRYGTTNVPVNTFNKVWIVPEKAVVYENAKIGAAYVVESKLKVMLEEDYLSLAKHEGQTTLRARYEGGQSKDMHTHALGSQIVREVVIPELTQEVNENKNFAALRQVYNSLILATWYKNKIKESIFQRVYVDKNKVTGISIDDPKEKQRIYQRYLRAFKKGAFNYVKDEMDYDMQAILPRKYFSGGVALFDLAMRANGVMRYTRQVPNSLDHAVIAIANLGIASSMKMPLVDHGMLSRMQSGFRSFATEASARLDWKISDALPADFQTVLNQRSQRDFLEAMGLTSNDLETQNSQELRNLWRLFHLADLYAVVFKDDLEHGLTFASQLKGEGLIQYLFKSPSDAIFSARVKAFVVLTYVDNSYVNTNLFSKQLLPTLLQLSELKSVMTAQAPLFLLFLAMEGNIADYPYWNQQNGWVMGRKLYDILDVGKGENRNVLELFTSEGVTREAVFEIIREKALWQEVYHAHDYITVRESLKEISNKVYAYWTAETNQLSSILKSLDVFDRDPSLSTGNGALPVWFSRTANYDLIYAQAKVFTDAMKNALVYCFKAY